MSTAKAPTLRFLLAGPAFAGLLAAGWTAGCSHDWDAYDPRVGGSGGAGAGATGGSTTSTGGSTTSTGGSTTSTGGSTTSTGGGGTGGSTTSTGGGGTGGGTGGSTTSTGGGGTGGATSSSSTGGAGTGGGGTGGGGPTQCGGTGVLADDFEIGDPGQVWDSDAWSGATVAETGGELVITLPANNADYSGAYFGTQRYYDFHNESVSVEVTNPANPMTSAYVYFSVGLSSNDYIDITQQGGILSFTRKVAGNQVSLKTTVYNPLTHRHWRFREDGVDTTYFETSSDGMTWVVQTQTPTADLFPIDFVHVEVGAGGPPNEPNPGEAHFDRVNGGGAPKEKWCAASSITDDFEDGVQGQAWKRSWENAPGILSETGGELVLTLLPDDTEYAGRFSSSSYDLTESSVLIEVPIATNPTSKSETSFHLHGPNDDDIEINKNQDQLKFSFDKANVTTDVGSVLYSPLQHRWWRIRESSDTLYWETSPDGLAWTIQTQYSPVPIPITSLDVEISGGTWDVQPDPGVAHFDHLNLPPP